MGIGIVLLLWAVLGTVAAALIAATLGGATALLTRGATGRRKVIISAVVFPFACLAWGGAVFVFQAIVNEGLLHRDLGMGDTWHAPLPNGYQIMMIDVTDQGWVYNPKTQPGSGVGEQEDAVAGVRKLQIAGQYILGGVDSDSSQHLGQETQTMDSFFILDTNTGRQAKYPTYDALHDGAQALQINLNLEPINTVYARFRFSWFDVFAAVLFFIPPLLGLTVLGWWVWRLRRTRVYPSLPTGAVS
jgi:hypothetical protein